MNPKISGRALNPFYNTTVKSMTSTSLTILQKVFIPAGTYEAGDLLIVNMLMGKTSGEIPSAFTHWLYSSPNDPDVSGITGATMVWSRAVGRSNQYIDYGRHLYIKNTTGGGSGIELGTEVTHEPTRDTTPSEMRSGVSVNLAINWSNGVYLFMAGQSVSPGDTISQYYLKIWDY